jgi:type IV secretion system protein VirB4
VGDMGHTFVFGPAGAGKSTFLCLTESQFLKYRNANVIILDKDKSARSITIAAGGVYAEPGGEDVAFQPLRDLETEVDLSWASEFIKLLLEMQGITCDAVMSEAIATALKQIRSEKTPERRTLSTFQQYVNYTSPQTGLNEIRIGIQPYTINGEYGRIFDAEDTRLSLSKWVMIEMGTLMKMGAAAVTPALMFLFRFIEKMYTKPNGDPTGDPTLLVLDEAWVFLDNDYFARKIEEWLVTLRKKKVFCVFATQEVSKAANSRLRTTIVSQCLTKIYLADPNAQSAIIAEYYRFFGLEDNEIAALSHARMKRDYFYKSPKGARLFELCLDEFQLALLTPDHALLDDLEKEYGKNSRKPLAVEILKRKGVTEWKKYVTQEGL